MNKYDVCSQNPVKQQAVDQVVPRMEVSNAGEAACHTMRAGAFSNNFIRILISEALLIERAAVAKFATATVRMRTISR